MLRYAALIVCLIFGQISFSYADQTLELWTSRPTDERLWQQINTDNLIPGVIVDVQFFQPGHYQQAIMTSNKLPDVFQWHTDQKQLEVWLSNQQIWPMTKAESSNIIPSAADGLFDPDNQLLGIPYDLTSAGILFDQASHADLESGSVVSDTQWLQKYPQFRYRTHIAGQSSWWIAQVFGEVLLSALLTDIERQKFIHGDICFNSPEFYDLLLQAENWLRDINPDPELSDYQSMQSSLTLGDSAMILDGFWAVHSNATVNPEFEPGVARIEGHGNQVPVFAGSLFLFSQASGEKDSLDRLRRFMVSPEFAEAQLKVGYIPATPVSQPELEKYLDAPQLQIASWIYERGAANSLWKSQELNFGAPGFKNLWAQSLAGMITKGWRARQASDYVHKGMKESEVLIYDRCRI